MARRIMRHKLVNISDIKEKMSLIPESDTDYITPSGKVYKDYGNNMFFPKKNRIEKHCGYVYCPITIKNGSNKNRRIHRLVAQAFIENPNGYNIVGHKNNIKHDNRIENLYWTTVKENTQKAFDDGLAKNDKGFDDSQSSPVVAINLETGERKEYGSVSECHRSLGISKSTVSRRCSGQSKNKPRCGYHFEYL